MQCLLRRNPGKWGQLLSITSRWRDNILTVVVPEKRLLNNAQVCTTNI